MTRKDYILIAEVLRVEFHNAKLHKGPMSSHVLSVAVSLADSLRRENSRFNTDHFLAVIRGEKALLSRPSSKAVQS